MRAPKRSCVRRRGLSRCASKESAYSVSPARRAYVPMRSAKSAAPSRATASRSATSSAHRSRGANSGGWFASLSVVDSVMPCILRLSIDAKKNPAEAGFFPLPIRGRLRHRNNAGGLRAFGALHDVVADALAFLQAAEALGVDRRVMHEHIGASVFRGDEPETLGVVEPLHGAVLHNLSDLVWMR